MKKRIELTFPAGDTLAGPVSYTAMVDLDESDFGQNFEIIHANDPFDSLGYGTAEDVSSGSYVPAENDEDINE